MEHGPIERYFMNSFTYYLCSILFFSLASRISYGDQPSGGIDGTILVEDHFAAYGLGSVLRMKVDPSHPDYGLAVIQMQENIGKETATNQFIVAIGPLTAAPVFPNSDGIPLNRALYLPVSRWSVDPNQVYFIMIAKRSNDYFLTSIDFVERWKEDQGFKQYIASGQLSLDKAEAEAIAEDLTSLRREMSRILATLAPNISDDEYLKVMGPLEKQEKELSDKYNEVWSRMKFVPLQHPIFQPPGKESSAAP